MQSTEVREKFLKFFEAKGHKIMPSSSLVTDDPSVLFTTAGMQQFKPYYLGFKDVQKDFGTKNTTSSQKCVRTNDIEEVGDDTHLTFFEMLGNFSFGGYWKEEAIKYAHEFITQILGLKIDYVSVFEGDAETPADNESREIWQKVAPGVEIRNHNRADNFWGPTGSEGPCGPTTEIYINGVEIWNIVFNEYYKTSGGKYTPLETKGIDTGMGLERLLVQVQGKKNVFETDIFDPIVSGLPQDLSEKDRRIIADHARTSLFLIADGVRAGSKERGSILRKLLRTLAQYRIDISVNDTFRNIKDKYKDIYPNLDLNAAIQEFDNESSGYATSKSATGSALVDWKKSGQPLTGIVAHGISSTLGASISDIKEHATKISISLSSNFDEEVLDATKKHQGVSKAGAEQKFKGGLANTNPETIKLHTAHHLLLAALQKVLGKEVKQKGSNITEERLRMDFSFPRKLTAEELRKVEEIVNKHIKEGLIVTRKDMPRVEAETIGAEMEFGAKYPDVVSLYFIEDKHGNAISKEFCGGPHVSNTSELGSFKILKEEAVSTGVRRIKAVLE